MNDTTPRESIAAAIWNVGAGGSPQIRYEDAGHMEEFQNETLREADAVIAMLWEAAMQPEVVEAVASANHERGRTPWWPKGDQWPNVPAAGREADMRKAKLIMVDTLTAILGPNPHAEQEVE